MLTVARARRSRTRPIGVITLTIGVLITVTIGGGWWWTDLQSRRVAHRLADQAMHHWSATRANGVPGVAPLGSSPGSPDSGESREAGIDGRVIAVLRIPRLGATWRMPVQRGTGTTVLRQGLGLYAGSPMPPAIGNVALAGHRTTWGAPLKHLDRLRPGDRITIWTATGRYDYQVIDTGITLPTDGSVIAPATAGGRAMLTLTTCNPEFSARQRLYVHALLTAPSRAA